MSNCIIEYRYFISQIAKDQSNNSNWLRNARKTEQSHLLGYSILRLRARARDFKQAIKNLFKGVKQ